MPKARFIAVGSSLVLATLLFIKNSSSNNENTKIKPLSIENGFILVDRGGFGPPKS